MSGPVLQTSGYTGGPSSDSGATITLTGVAVGSAIVAFLSGVSLAGETVSGYTQVGSPTPINNYVATCFVKFGSAGGTESVVASWSSTNFTSLTVVELSAASAASLIGSATATPSPGTTAADAVTVGPASPNNTGNATVLGYSLAQAGIAPTTGTGYTSQGTFCNFGSGGIIALESKSVSSASAAATWTAGTSSDVFINFVLVFDASAPVSIGVPAGEWNFQAPVTVGGKVARSALPPAVLGAIPASPPRPGIDFNFQRPAAPPARIAPRDVLPNRAPPKAWPADVSFLRAHVRPGRVTYDQPFNSPLLPKAWPADVNFQRPAAPPSRWSASEVLPGPLSAPSSLAWAADGPAQLQARAPLRITHDTQLSVDSVLSPWAADGNPQIQSRAPSRVAHTTELPGFSAPTFFTWAADGNIGRALPGPSRVAHDVQLPAVSVLSIWSADGNAMRPLAAPSRVSHDAQLPTVSVLSAWAGDGNATRNLPAPARVAHDVQLPFTTVLSTWAADGNQARSLPAPTRVSHTTELKTTPPPLLFTWAADGNPSRALPGPLRVLHDVQQPRANALSVWATDAQLARLLPGPGRAQTDAQLPSPVSAVLTWAADGNSTKPQPAPARAVVDAPLPAATAVLAKPPTDWSYQRSQAWPARATQDPTVLEPTVAAFVGDWNFQRLSLTPARAAQSSDVSRPLGLPFAPDWYYARLVAGSVAMSPLFGGGPLPRLRPPAAWAADWNFQRAPLALFSSYSVYVDSIAPPFVPIFAFVRGDALHRWRVVSDEAGNRRWLTASEADSTRRWLTVSEFDSTRRWKP